jgi:hypothetical protein
MGSLGGCGGLYDRLVSRTLSSLDLPMRDALVARQRPGRLQCLDAQVPQRSLWVESAQTAEVAGRRAPAGALFCDRVDGEMFNLD